MYFHQAPNLNCRQAQWLLNLADFNLKIIHVLGRLLAGLDALSHCSDLHPNDSDNLSTVLLPDSLFVNLIDTKLHERISDSSKSNPLVLQHLQSSLEDISTAFWSCLLDWKYNDHVLTYKGHVYVPLEDSLHRSILTRCHDHKTAGHSGYLKTRQLVTTEFWWPGLAQFVCKYIEGYATCQQNKSNTHPTVPPLTPIRSYASCPFQQVSCDLITGLSASSGFDSLLVMVDHGFTKGVILCPTKKTITAKGVAALFFHKVYLHFGLYDKIISDCGPQFTSAFTKELSKLLNYNLSLHRLPPTV